LWIFWPSLEREYNGQITQENYYGKYRSGVEKMSPHKSLADKPVFRK